MLQDVVECTLGDVFPFVLSIRWYQEGDMGKGGKGDEITDDEQDVGVLRLHARRDARVFVAGKVLGVDHGDDCV